MTATLFPLFLAILFLASLTSVACRFHPLSPPLAPRAPHRYTLRAGAFETPLLSSADEVLQNYEQAKSLVDIQASSAAASAAGSASASASAAPQPIRAPAPATSLAPLRLLMFLFYCSLGTIGPYLPVFYQSLSLPGIWIGILGAITPLMTLLASPIWGWWIDKHCGSSKSKSVVLLYAYLGSVCGRLAMPGLCEGGAESSGRKVALVGLIAATSFLFAPVKPLLDAMVMRRLDQRSTTTNNNNNNKNNSGGVNAYGKMRLWGQIGFGVGSSLVGLCMRRFNEGMQGYELLSMGMGGKNSYLFAFLAHAAVSVPTGVAIINCRVSDGDGDGDGDNNISTSINVDDDENNDEEEDPQQDQNNNKNGVDIAAGLRLMTSQPPILLFFSLIFVIGMASGIIENFAYVRLREVGGTGREMGISRFVSAAAGVPMFFFSGNVAGKFSVDEILIASLLAYVVRFGIYASMRRALGWGLLAEALRGVTFGAFWSAATIHAHKIAPKGMETTIMAILNASYGGLGQSVGAVVGGSLQGTFGTVNAFKVSGGGLLAVAMAFGVYAKMMGGI